MSIYSGFAKREQETYYNGLVVKALYLLADRIVAFVRGRVYEDEAWQRYIRKIHRVLLLMEKTKYLEPKYSFALDDLVDLLKEKYGSFQGTSVGAGSMYSGGGLNYESTSSRGGLGFPAKRKESPEKGEKAASNNGSDNSPEGVRGKAALH